MIPVYPQPLPQPNTQVAKSGGSLADSFFFLLRALHLRTGGNSGLPVTVGADLVAGSLSAPLQLSDDINEILQKIGAGPFYAQLADLQPGQSMLVFNGLAVDPVNILPSGGGQIDALGTNIAYSLVATKIQIFTAYSIRGTGGIQFRSLQLG